MALVEIDDIELGAPQPGKIQAFAIDAPRIGGRNVYDIEFAGWVLGESQPVKRSKSIRVASSSARRRSTSNAPMSLRDYPDVPRVRDRAGFAPGSA